MEPVPRLPDDPGTPTSRSAAGSRRLVVHGIFFVLTALTTSVAGAYWARVDPFVHPAFLVRGIPYAASLMAILLVHEAGHYLMCVRHRINASLPYFLPAPPQMFIFGTFGAFIRIRTRFPHRNALFDVGAAGPWGGFVVALFAMIFGLQHSTVAPTAPTQHVMVFGDSLLTAFLTRAVLHADPATVILHPVGLAGWFGLFVTSVNLLPVGQLDGGHVLFAAAGRATRVVPALMIAVLVWLGVRVWPGWIVWAVIITVLHTMGHPHTDDDRRPLGGGRLLATVATLVVFVLTFVAEPFKILP